MKTGLGLLLLAFLATAGLLLALWASSDDGAPSQKATAALVPEFKTEDILPFSPYWAQEEWLAQFLADGGDPSTLPRKEAGLPHPTFDNPLSQEIGDSAAIVRGVVVDQGYYSRAVIFRRGPVHYCRTVSTVKVLEVLKGSSDDKVRILQGGCPLNTASGPVFHTYHWDPVLEKGREYVLFMKANPGLLSEMDEAQIDEGITRMYLGSSSAQLAVLSNDALKTITGSLWSRALDGATIDHLRYYIQHPEEIPLPPPTPIPSR